VSKEEGQKVTKEIKMRQYSFQEIMQGAALIGTYNEYNGELCIEISNIDKAFGLDKLPSRITLVNWDRHLVTFSNKDFKVISHGVG